MNIFGRKKIHTYSDLELVEQYKRTEDKRYVGELFKRYSRLVYGVCLKYLKNPAESQDMVMQVFEKLMDTLLAHDVKNFKSWLHTVSRNHCLMYLRKYKNIKEVGDTYTLEQITDVNTEEEIDVENKYQLLELAIEHLKPEQKECVALFYLKGKCYQEVAEITGFTLKEVKSHLQNGKRNLKIQLEKNEAFMNKEQ